MSNPEPAVVSARDALTTLWPALGGDADDLAHLELRGADLFYPTDFAVGTAAAASVGAATLAVARIAGQRTGVTPQASIDLRHAAVAFRSERYLSIDGAPPAELWARTAGYYRTGDARWIQLHTNFEHHRERALGVLGLAGAETTRDEVAAAVATKDAFALEEALAAAGACAFVMRSRDEWRAHPQGAAVAALPVVSVEHRPDAPAEPLVPHAGGEPALAGVRVLDLTRVIAGPVCGRMLTAHGADVLRIGSETLPLMGHLVIDTGFGKRFAHIDLRTQAGRETLTALIRDADVVVQGYRPGALAALGFDFDTVAQVRPGIVYVSLCAWSHAGPWAERRGFDSLVQTASGIAHEGGARRGEDAPRPLPAQALDHATGYVAAAAATLALAHRVTVGGSTHVRLSLAQTGHWFDALGRVDGAGGADPARADVADLLDEMDSAWGRLSFVRPAGMVGETPPRWLTPPPRPGADAPAWRER